MVPESNLQIVKGLLGEPRACDFGYNVPGAIQPIADR
jgi:hypothetical protein